MIETVERLLPHISSTRDEVALAIAERLVRVVELSVDGERIGALFYIPGEPLWLSGLVLSRSVSFSSLRTALRQRFGCSRIAWESRRRGWQRIVKRLGGSFTPLGSGWLYEV